MTHYVPGDRVWVQMDGFPWWPARVITPEDLKALNVPDADLSSDLDLDLLFYSGLSTPESVMRLNSRRDAHRVCFFEASSEKAVTSDDDLAAAIRKASEDKTANPIRADAIASAMTTSAGAASSGHRRDAAISRSAVEEVGRKRARESDEQPALPAGYIELDSHALKSVASALEEAIAASSVGAVRRELLRLDRVDVTLKQLHETKIGVAVGNVKKSEACRSLWPLARAIISFWARKLPPDTIRALKELQNQHAAPSLGVANAAELQYPASPYGPGSPGSVLSPGGRQSAFSQHQSSPAAADANRSRRLRFQDQLYQELNNPLSTKKYSDARINEVIAEIRNHRLDEDDRLELLLRLRTEEIGEKIREGLLSGDWTFKKYLEMPREAFLTNKQVHDAERRVKEKIAAEEEAQQLSINATSMFECPECQAKNATYTEVQTRGADEPTTKFITCLECHTTWRDE